MLECKTVKPLQVSKWIKVPLLVDACEMEELINSLPPFKVYDVQRVTDKHEGIYDPSAFLEKYRLYVEVLKRKEMPMLQEFRALFSAVWSVTEEALVSLPTQDERRLLKVTLPCIQTQINQIRYDEDQKTFRNQVYSADSISWGIQLGFPHLFLDPSTCQPSSTRDFPNMALFTGIQKWVRTQTVPTPFLINGLKINSPIRLGKRCFTWISNHLQLQANNISIDRAN